VQSPVSIELVRDRLEFSFLGRVLSAPDELVRALQKSGVCVLGFDGRNGFGLGHDLVAEKRVPAVVWLRDGRLERSAIVSRVRRQHHSVMGIDFRNASDK
jgi:hypothetical protein